MNEIICPNCKTAFKVDETGYADILKQVRDDEFEKQLHDRLELADKDKQNAVELAKAKLASEMERSSAAKNSEILELKAKLDAADIASKHAVTEALAKKDAEIQALNSKLQNFEEWLL